MKIIRHKSHSLASRRFTLPTRQHMHHIDMQKLYTGTVVSEVFIQKSCYQAISKFVEESKLQHPVKEVGGFLLGNYVKDNDGIFKTHVELFVPASQVAFSSPTLLDFGTDAMMEWDKAQEQHPELRSVGWFHTHPGHSPYLSAKDMNIHEGFFRQAFQIAMVLDPLTEDWNTGIFCRNLNGEMVQRIPAKAFLLWLELMDDI